MIRHLAEWFGGALAVAYFWSRPEELLTAISMTAIAWLFLTRRIVVAR